MSEARPVDELLQDFASLYAASMPRNAVSAVAEAVRVAAETALGSIERSQSLSGPKIEAVDALRAFENERSTANWDGYAGAPLERRAIGRALAWIRVLPSDLPLAEIATDPDGSVALEWWLGTRLMISMSVGARNALPYAWLDGEARGHDVAAFDGRFSPARLACVLRAMKRQADAPASSASVER